MHPAALFAHLLTPPRYTHLLLRVNRDHDGCAVTVLLVNIVPRNAKEPWLKFRIILQGSQLLIHGYKGFLRQIFRFFDRSDHSVNKIQNLARELIVNSLKGPYVPFLASSIQRTNRAGSVAAAPGFRSFIFKLNSPVNDPTHFRKFRLRQKNQVGGPLPFLVYQRS